MEKRNRFEKGDIIFGTYRVETDAIETGTTSQVWKVRHLGKNIDLAMKFPREEYIANKHCRELFIRECKLWVGLGLHPNIVSCCHVRETDGFPVVFFEWQSGGSLSNLIKSKRLYEGSADEILKRILRIAVQSMEGLCYAHKKTPPIIHKDIKPGNILFTADGEAKITDFGISESVSEGFTVPYRSPEQSRRETLTPATDIYSWAVTVLEMFCGKRNWRDGVEAGRYFEEISSEAREPIPEELKRLLKRCLEKEPSLRPRSGEAAEGLLVLCERLFPDEVFISRQLIDGESIADRITERSDALKKRFDANNDRKGGFLCITEEITDLSQDIARETNSCLKG